MEAARAEADGALGLSREIVDLDVEMDAVLRGALLLRHDLEQEIRRTRVDDPARLRAVTPGAFEQSPPELRQERAVGTVERHLLDEWSSRWLGARHDETLPLGSGLE
jgi:hypothetical protein